MRQPRRPALSSPAGSRAPGRARSRCPPPSIPQAGAAICCLARECAGPAAADRRRSQAERRAWAAADSLGHPPYSSRGRPGPSGGGAASPRSRGRESGAAPGAPHGQRSLLAPGAAGEHSRRRGKALPPCGVLLNGFCFGSMAVVYLCVRLSRYKMLLILKSFWWCGTSLTLGYF